MLWLCTYFPALPLEALGLAPEAVAAVAERKGAHTVLIRVTPGAASRGLRAGMRVSAALALVPELRILPRDPAREIEALETAACWAYDFGRPVTVNAGASCVWTEIGGSLKLFGGGAGLWSKIVEQGVALANVRRYGIAPTLGASLLLARRDAGFTRPILHARDIAARLHTLPLDGLDLDDVARTVLTDAGLRSLGEVLAIPAAALVRRFGPEVVAMLSRLTGKSPDAWRSFEPPARYGRRVELDGGVETTEALPFPLRAMLSDFVVYLRARDAAVQAFVVRFAGGRTIPFPVALLAPTRDLSCLLGVVRERLERITLDDPV